MSDGNSIRGHSAIKREADYSPPLPATKRPFLPRPPVEGFRGAFARREDSVGSRRTNSTRATLPRESLPLRLQSDGGTTPAPVPPVASGGQLPGERTDEVDVKPAIELPGMTEEKRPLHNYISMLETALNSKEGGREQVTKLKSLFRPQLDLNRTEVDMLRKQNAELEDEKETIAHHATNLERKVRTLEAEISNLSLDLRERERLYDDLKRAKPTQEDPTTDIDMAALAKENRKLHKAARKHDKRIEDMTEDCDTLTQQLRRATKKHDTLTQQLADKDAALTHTRTALHDEQFRFKILQEEKRNVERQSSAQLNQIVQLRRDLTKASTALKQSRSAPGERSSNIPPNPVPVAAPVPTPAQNIHLLTKLGGMFTHYRTLHAKNEALWDKLWGMAKAGGFGNHGSNYRRELEDLRGAALEELDEWKCVNGG